MAAAMTAEPSYIWGALGVSALVTLVIRYLGVKLAKHPIFSKLKEETLSRRFPLVILLILIFKEAVTGSERAGVLGAKLGALAFVVLLQWRFRNVALSIVAGTGLYVAWLHYL